MYGKHTTKWLPYRERCAPLGDAERERERPLNACRRSPACRPPLPPPSRSAAEHPSGEVPSPRVPPEEPPYPRSSAALRAAVGGGAQGAPEGPASQGWRSISPAVARRSGS